MGAHANVAATAAEGHEGGHRLYFFVWGWLLALTAVEVFLAYLQLPLKIMLACLLVLSVIKAALIMAYFMHLKFERFRLIVALIPALLICIGLLFASLPESFRILELGTR